MRIGAHDVYRVRQMHIGEQGQGARTALLALHLFVKAENLVDLIADGHDRVQRGHRLLKDHRHLLAAQAPQVRVRSPTLA